MVFVQWAARTGSSLRHFMRVLHKKYMETTFVVGYVSLLYSINHLGTQIYFLKATLSLFPGLIWPKLES